MIKKIAFNLGCWLIRKATGKTADEVSTILIYGETTYKLIEQECARQNIKMEDAFLQHETRVISKQQVAEVLNKIMDDALLGEENDNLPVC